MSPPGNPEWGPAAVIWISGLGAPGIEEGLEEVARRVAFACDRNAVAEASFAVRSAIRPEHAGNGLDVPRCTVLRTDTTGTQPVLDFYGLATVETLIGDRAQRPLRSQLWSAARTVHRAVWKAWKARNNDRMGKRERQQLVYAYAGLLLSILGLVVLLFTAAATVVTAVLADIPNELRAVVGPIGAIGAWSFWKSATARKLGSAALVVYSVIDYLDRADDKGSLLRGQLAQLLEHLAELKRPHDSIDVMAYSFGSIVAIDALFPHVQEPPRRLATITSLITIACPFDFVRSYWPGYFAKRFSRAGAPAAWVNLYAPSDVLATRFGEDSGPPEAIDPPLTFPLRVEVREDEWSPPDPTDVPYLIDGREEPVSWLEAVLLKGLHFHGQYWSSRVASEEGVFDQVISVLGDQPAITQETIGDSQQ